MSKKNKGTKNINDAGVMKNAQNDAHMENSNKTTQGNAQNNAQNCNHKSGK